MIVASYTCSSPHKLECTLIVDTYFRGFKGHHLHAQGGEPEAKAIMIVYNMLLHDAVIIIIMQSHTHDII